MSPAQTITTEELGTMSKYNKEINLGEGFTPLP